MVYFTGYLARLNYAASLAEMVLDLGVTKQLVSIGVTGSFLTYGIGQLVSGILGDRVTPRALITLGLLGTALCNLAVTCIPSIYGIAAVWCVNGFFQSLLWPPLVRSMGETLAEPDYHRVCLWITAAASVATIAVYVIVPVCIVVSGWRLSFYLAAGAALLIAAAWFFLLPRIPRDPASMSRSFDAVPKAGARIGDLRLGKLLVSAGAVPLLVAIMAQGILRNGLTTWMPTFITEVYHIGTSVSILTTAVLPAFAIVSVLITAWLLKRMKNELFGLILLFGASAFAALGIVAGGAPILTVALMALVTGAMQGANLIFSTRLPVQFAAYGCVATLSGIVNAATYAGSALSIYGIAALSESFGWGTTTWLWVGVAVLGTLCCFLAVPAWQKFLQREAPRC